MISLMKPIVIIVMMLLNLEMHQIAKCGHWTQQEKPEELNRILVDWLGRRFAEPGTPV